MAVDDLRSLAEELLAIQHGSVEDALALAEDFPDDDMRDELVELIETIGEETKPMTTTTTNRADKAQTAIDSVGVAREAYEAFQDAWREVGRVMRELDEWQWHRVDAYPSWNGTRDVGAGVDMDGWMTEVEERLDAIRSGEPDSE